MASTTVILSPHFDDAVLSCWDVLTGPGDVRVVNVFAGVPPTGTSGWWDELAGVTNSAQAVGKRADEDRRALALAGREATNLDFLDSQYRGRPQPHEPLVTAVEGSLPAGATLYAPAAFARFDGVSREPHADHLALRTAALALRDAGFEVVLYADLPHASADGWPDWVVGENGGGDGRAAERWERVLGSAGVAAPARDARVVDLDPSALARKLEAVHAYASQLRLLEAAFDDLTGRLRHEVDWRLPPAG